MCKVIGNNVLGEQHSELHASVARLHAPPPHVIIRLTDQLTTSEIGNNKWLVCVAGTRINNQIKHRCQNDTHTGHCAPHQEQIYPCGLYILVWTIAIEHTAAASTEITTNKEKYIPTAVYGLNKYYLPTYEITYSIPLTPICWFAAMLIFYIFFTYLLVINPVVYYLIVTRTYIVFAYVKALLGIIT